MKFWDSSALVPLLVRQEASARLTRMLRRDPAVIAWWAARVECESAIARLERSGQLLPVQAQRARARLHTLASGWAEVDPGDALREAACRALRRHDLRAADAMQLAAALTAAEQSPATLEFVCLDERLAHAAEREGFPVVGTLGGVQRSGTRAARGIGAVLVPAGGRRGRRRREAPFVYAETSRRTRRQVSS